MKTAFHATLILQCFAISLLLSCKGEKSQLELLHASIQTQLDSINGDVALAYVNLADPSDSLMINAEEEFHAASTMKVPVMIELYKQQKEGKIDLNDSIVLINEFKSIVDSSFYSMDIVDDSDDDIYSKIGTSVAFKDLTYSMITVSSNLATNVLIELVGAKNITATMRALGADKIKVLRGVEDTKAYELGLSNTTTAKDLMVIMRAIAESKAGTEADCVEMISILKDQQFNSIIPYFLPDEVKVAHKTGSIVGVHHDAGIVYLPDGRAYVLVILSKNLKEYDKATEQLAGLSKTVYDYMVGQ
ncbi:class A beta-lactamase-related serine hydrolase [Algoriphagus sp. AGSA1]|uniref:serine hydrolase n=1 Tax=Algoriphagus sp. AGSA1 TaxID=2907213 RepID=UPI001F3169AE|nr:serine hydrolase [Algoriphagus sp. AGSA1]MCE7055470.1 class A beta-lactamase-related serine hydrolase [Algoriphagus sp. AGSA1]